MLIAGARPPKKIIDRALERKAKGFTAIKVLLEPFTAIRV
jgi:hypothetical protein